MDITRRYALDPNFPDSSYKAMSSVAHSIRSFPNKLFGVLTFSSTIKLSPEEQL